MHVSYDNYRRMHEFLRDEIRKELGHLLALDSDEELFCYQRKNEGAIGRYLGRGYAVGFCSGTSALQLSLAALGIGKGDEVVTSSNTYVSTLLAIAGTGARPVLADSDPHTMLADIDEMLSCIRESTKAIVPVHLYGQMMDTARIRKMAKNSGIFLVEDACQAHLAKFNGSVPGKHSEVACYSFFPSKNIGGIANGGMAITKSRALMRRLRALRNPMSGSRLLLRSGRTPAYLDWMQIAFIKCKLKYAKDWTMRRREIAQRYFESLGGLDLEMPGVRKEAHHVFRNFVVRTSRRNRFRKYLFSRGVETRIHYQNPPYLNQTFSFLGYKKGSFPVTERLCNEALSLPIHPLLADNEVEYVIACCKDFFR